MAKGPEAPEPPSPTKTANAQMRSNIGTAAASQFMTPNQVTPFGSSTNTQTGTSTFNFGGKTYQIPTFTNTTTLNPQEQAIANANARTRANVVNNGITQSTRLGSILGQPMSAPSMATVGAGPKLGTVGAGPDLAQTFGNAGAVTRTYGSDDFSDNSRRVEEALMSRMSPDLARARSAREAQLANQGIRLGTEAYDRAQTQLGQNENDARMQAILAGGQEQSRLTGLEAGRAQFQNSAQQQVYDQLLGRAGFGNAAMQQERANQVEGRGFDNDAIQQMRADQFTRAGFNNGVAQQGFGNQQALRSGALGEMGSLLGMGQPNTPAFSGGGGQSLPFTDVGGLMNNQYQGQMANYQQQLQGRNQMMGGLFGLGAAGISALPWGSIMPAIGLSDERTKDNIEPLGEVDVPTADGPEPLPVYAYEYKHDPGTKHVGFMAQEVKKVRPDAIVPMGKFLGVNYSKLVA